MSFSSIGINDSARGPTRVPSSQTADRRQAHVVSSANFFPTPVNSERAPTRVAHAFSASYSPTYTIDNSEYLSFPRMRSPSPRVFISHHHEWTNGDYHLLLNSLSAWFWIAVGVMAVAFMVFL